MACYYFNMWQKTREAYLQRDNDKSAAEQFELAYGIDPASVSQEVMEWFCDRAWPPFQWGESAAAKLAVNDQREDVISFLKANDGLRPSIELAPYAAAVGNLEVLEMCREEMLRHSSDDVANAAVSCKNNPAMEWLVANNFGNELIYYAVARRDLGTIKYLIGLNTTCSYNAVWQSLLMTNRDQSFHAEERESAFNIVKYLVELRVPFSRKDPIWVQEGRVHIPFEQWAAENGLEPVWMEDNN